MNASEKGILGNVFHGQTSSFGTGVIHNGSKEHVPRDARSVDVEPAAAPGPRFLIFAFVLKTNGKEWNDQKFSLEERNMCWQTF